MLNFRQLVAERDTWVAHNFPNPTEPPPGESIQGCIEELGELTHGRLKKAQSIRGTDEQHDETQKDAIGDLTVYLLGVMSAWGVIPNRDHFKLRMSDRRAVGALASWLGHMDAVYLGDGSQWSQQDIIDRVVFCMECYCKDHGWDYDAIVQETWDAVKQRDWILYPDTGLPPEQHEDSPFVKQARAAATMFHAYKVGEVVSIDGFGMLGAQFVVDSVIDDAVTVKPLETLTPEAADVGD